MCFYVQISFFFPLHHQQLRVIWLDWVDAVGVDFLGAGAIGDHTTTAEDGGLVVQNDHLGGFVHMGLVPLGEVHVVIQGALGTCLDNQIRTHAKVVKLLIVVEIYDVVFFVDTHRFASF